MDRFRKIAIKILKPIENQIYLPQREAVIEAIVKELEQAREDGYEAKTKDDSWQ